MGIGKIVLLRDKGMIGEILFRGNLGRIFNRTSELRYASSECDSYKCLVEIRLVQGYQKVLLENDE